MASYILLILAAFAAGIINSVADGGSFFTFPALVFTGVPSIKEIGLGSAIAIALDATLVRLILVPAAMKLMGSWNWWMPKPP